MHDKDGVVDKTEWPQMRPLYAELARRTPSASDRGDRAVADRPGRRTAPPASRSWPDVLASGELAEYCPLHTAPLDMLDPSWPSRRGPRAWALQ